MSRVPFICGNWKMHKTVGEAVELVEALIPQVEGLGSVEVGVTPPFTALAAVKAKIEGTRIRLAAQNCHFEAQGAFTGEVSVGMLKDVGCDYILIGHSERRQMFGETDEGVNKKLHAILAGGLRAIVAIGETLEEREANQTLAVVERQLKGGLAGLTAEQLADVVIAYEPVWAIGTGRTATPEQAQEVHAALRAQLTASFTTEAAQGVRIQYGGSMKPGNAKELLAQGDIDGGLIGGAALKAEDFTAICAAGAASAGT